MGSFEEIVVHRSQIGGGGESVVSGEFWDFVGFGARKKVG